jgi:hypothetical protein
MTSQVADVIQDRCVDEDFIPMPYLSDAVDVTDGTGLGPRYMQAPRAPGYGH